MCAQNLSIDLLSTMDLKISFPHGKMLNPLLKSKKFNTPENKSEWLDCILSIHVNQNVNSIDKATSQLLQCKPFNEFQVRHKHTNYFHLFYQKKIYSKDYFKKNRKIRGQIIHHYTEDKKCDNQIHIAQIREVFQKILYKVVSQELIGNYRNKKKILKTLHNFLLTARNEYFSLKSLIKQINISSIKWLKVIDDDYTKYILLIKFIKWLFHYFIRIIFDQFYVTYIKEERIFIFLKDWNIQKKNFLKKMYQKMALEPLKIVTTITNIQSKLFLIPKFKGIRSIVIQKYSNNEKQELRKVISILKYLHQTNLSKTNSNFDRKYIQFVRENNFMNNKIYIISSDIRNAYDSIRQDKLFNILKEMFKELPYKLIFEWYITRNSKKYKYVKINANLSKVQFETCNKFEVTKKHNILKKLEQFIYNTKVVINNKVFNLCKGIAQGLMLSAILCDIYYAHMRKKYFSHFENFGYHFAYVDDNIYLTKSLKHAKEYINRIKKGIPEYNCWFNESKLKYNFNKFDSSKIEYLGWMIDPHSLEIEPKYNSSRYSLTFASLNSLNLSSTCDLKIQNLASLKLNKLVLSKEINSENQIFSNVQSIALHHAKRCYAFANYLYENQYKLTIEIIKKLNFKILHIIENLTKWDKYEVSQKKKKIRFILWQSFYNVFNKKREIFLYLIKDFKRLMKKYT